MSGACSLVVAAGLTAGGRPSLRGRGGGPYLFVEEVPPEKELVIEPWSQLHDGDRFQAAPPVEIASP